MSDSWGGKIYLQIGILCIIVGVAMAHHATTGTIGVLVSCYGLGNVGHMIASWILPASKIIDWYENRKKNRK